MKEPTIHDVAQKAGVSVATVSRVLNGKAIVGEGTRNLVLEAMETLGYRPNRVAQSLARRSSRLVGVVVPDIANPYFAEVARGMGDAAAADGYLLTLANAELTPAKEIEYIGLFTEQRVDGLLYTSGQITPALAELFASFDRPVALAATWDPQARWPAVLVDSYQGARLAVDHLVSLGHSRIGVINGNLDDPISGSPRWQGYADAAREHGVPIQPGYMGEGRFQQEAAYQEMRRLLRLKEPPTGVVVASDLMAIAAISAALDEGRSVPDELSVVGFDDIGLATATRPRLTTIAQPMYEIGAQAMRRLIRQIAGQPVEPQALWLAPRLVVRDSTTLLREP